MHDLVIRNARLYDGSGAPGTAAIWRSRAGASPSWVRTSEAGARRSTPAGWR